MSQASQSFFNSAVRLMTVGFVYFFNVNVDFNYGFFSGKGYNGTIVIWCSSINIDFYVWVRRAPDLYRRNSLSYFEDLNPLANAARAEKGQ
jgi:hypothetical protein